MALELYISLQKPTIELKLEAKDPSGEKASILVGFKRYEPTDDENAHVNLQFKKFQEVIEAVSEGSDKAMNDLIDYFKEEVVYIKKAELELYDTDTDKTTVLKIEDTRKAKTVEPIWADGDTCLAVLLSKYLLSPPWIGSFISAAPKALLNADLMSQALAGNS